MDLVKAGFLFLRHCVFELGGPLCTWQKRLSDNPKSVASCDLDILYYYVIVYQEFVPYHCSGLFIFMFLNIWGDFISFYQSHKLEFCKILNLKSLVEIIQKKDLMKGSTIIIVILS